MGMENSFLSPSPFPSPLRGEGGVRGFYAIIEFFKYLKSPFFWILV
jgi:hypothetical protein